MSIWKNWYEIRDASSKADRVFLYGRSEDWVHKAVKNIGIPIAGIIDRDESYDGTLYLDLHVQPFEKWNVTNNDFIVITAGDFDGIVDFLTNLHFLPGSHFACSPDFQDYHYVINFHARDFELLVSCSDYNDQTRARSSRLGGGIYTLNTENHEFVKKIEGSFRQVKQYLDGYVTVDYVDKYLLYFDKDFEINKKIDLDKPNYCGVAVDEVSDCIYVSNAGTDEILVIEKFSSEACVFSKLNFMARSGRKRESHVNDLYYSDGKLFYSYFSKSGNYKFGVFDGGVSHYDTSTKELCRDVIVDCWKPHSPVVHDGNLWVLDSMRGRLLSGVSAREFKMSGFVRGLDFSDDVAVIGQSQDMYISDRLGGSELISVDSGVYLLDTKSSASRFIPLNSIMNVHDLKVLKNV